MTLRSSLGKFGTLLRHLTGLGSTHPSLGPGTLWPGLAGPEAGTQSQSDPGSVGPRSGAGESASMLPAGPTENLVARQPSAGMASTCAEGEPLEEAMCRGQSDSWQSPRHGGRRQPLERKCCQVQESPVDPQVLQRTGSGDVASLRQPDRSCGVVPGEDRWHGVACAGRPAHRAGSHWRCAHFRAKDGHEHEGFVRDAGGNLTQAEGPPVGA